MIYYDYKNMGFDDHTVYILFGVQIPKDDYDDVFKKLNCMFIRPKQRIFNIPDVSYRLINYGDYAYISLSSIPFGVGEDNWGGNHIKVDLPTSDQVDTFKSFLLEKDLNYQYEQYFLSC